MDPPQQQQCDFHHAVYRNQVDVVRSMLAANPKLANQADRHGNPPLHLAAHLRHKQMVLLLLEHGADVTAKNGGGWSSLQEVIASGSKELTTIFYIAINDYFQKDYIQKLPQLFQLLKDLPDCYIELKWSVYSWVPLVSRFCPNDHYKIWKKGSNLRVDTTLVGFENLSWLRGHLSFVYCGENSKMPGELVIVNYDKQLLDFMMKASRELTPEHIVDDVEDLMKNDLWIFNIDTKESSFTTAKTWFGYDRVEQVGPWTASVYDVHKVIYRTEQRSTAALRAYHAQQKLAEKGTSELGLDWENRPKRQEEKAKHDFDEYFKAPLTHPPGKSDGLLYPSEKVTRKAKEYKARVWLAEKFPQQIDRLLPILELLMPSSRSFFRVKELLTQKMPRAGFPVKVDIPLVPTVSLTAEITLYEEKEIADSVFVIPQFKVATPEIKRRLREEKQKRAQNGGKQQ